MFRDPLYRQIRRALRELKDGNAFESCACDLLRQVYPSLRRGKRNPGLIDFMPLGWSNLIYLPGGGGGAGGFDGFSICV